jgi:hypothetical protein
MTSWFGRLRSAFRPEARVSGEPRSGNGASSFHLWWDVPYGERLTRVSAVLEVLEPPAVDRLSFWALQTSFVKPDGGGAHLGFQHNRRFPGRTAVNWGGYAPSYEGGLLHGSPSPLASTPNDQNTRDFAWEPIRPYRLTIARSPDPAPDGLIAWRGTIEDVGSGEVTVVRDLYSHGEYLRGPVVWTECFARCEHPSSAVRWSELTVVGEDHGEIAVTAVSVNYQSHAAGGCANTDATVDNNGWIQRTNTERTTAPGATLRLA